MSGRRLRIAVLGAARTGKTRLVMELAQALARSPCEMEVFEAAAPFPELPDLIAPSDLILLTGVDLPSEDITAQEQTRQDSQLRETLQRAGLAWRVVYGQGADRLGNALQAVAEATPWALTATLSESEAGRWARLQANCEKCGDAACEHRLFTGLVND